VAYGDRGAGFCHGQWDWMNDPEIPSSTWEWDMVGLSSQWRYSHNYRHQVFTNVLEMDDVLGFGVMRLSRDRSFPTSSTECSRLPRRTES
jgi:fatty acid desaturase